MRKADSNINFDASTGYAQQRLLFFHYVRPTVLVSSSLVLFMPENLFQMLTAWHI